MRIGIDVGGSHIGAGLIDSSGNMISKKSKDLYKPMEAKQITEEIIVLLIRELLKEQNINSSDVEMIGLAIPGTVEAGYIVKAENLHIKNFNIAEELNKHFNAKVHLRNDAKCAALAEKEYGSLKKAEDAIFLTIGTGVGGAVFLNNKLLRPKKYEGFEVGHMVIQENGIKCNCGNYGCFERYASMKALKDEIEKEFNVQGLNGIQLQDIIEANINSENVKNILKNYIYYLSIGIANLINIFEPDTISIGGSFVYYKEILLNRLKERLSEKHVLFNEGSISEIVLAEFKNDAGILGATIL